MTIDTELLRRHVSAAAYDNISLWLHEPKYVQYAAELEQLIQEERWKELEDSFFKVLEFGTAGRRGTVGIGSNRINRVTIGESTQALCLYAGEFDEAAREKGIVIACDTRLSSPELSRIAAEVCAANGFKTYIFDSFRSTPELSFAVRYLGAVAGIVISASHNPPADNGFKAYWSDGGQLVSPHDKGVLAKAAEIHIIESVDFDEAVSAGDIVIAPCRSVAYLSYLAVIPLEKRAYARSSVNSSFRIFAIFKESTDDDANCSAIMRRCLLISSLKSRSTSVEEVSMFACDLALSSASVRDSCRDLRFSA